MNRLFLADKPAGIGSNKFLSTLKRKYGVKKAGFSGTLDPFASGALIVAFGQYARFFRFLKKEPKVYTATLWLGAQSPSGDNENIGRVEQIPPLSREVLDAAMTQMRGEIKFIPPAFSAKKIDGVRAYKLARAGEEVSLKESSMRVFDAEILSYARPFVSFRVALSEGGYVRSFAQILVEKLGVCGTLSTLRRESEGAFDLQDPRFADEAALNPLEFLDLQPNFYDGDARDVILGKKLVAKDLATRADGRYLLICGDFYSIIEISSGEVRYLWNDVPIAGGAF